jgi:hypothetical protein
VHDTSGGNCLHEIVGERLRAPTCSAMGGRHFLEFCHGHGHGRSWRNARVLAEPRLLVPLLGSVRHPCEQQQRQASSPAIGFAREYHAWLQDALGS